MNAEVGSPTPVTLDSSDGVQLQAEYHVPDEATAVVVLSHPHPQYGGDMFNPLIDQLFGLLPQAGIATVRYNFRGVGQSTGTHAEGRGEQDDAASAFAFGSSLPVNGPLVSAGWSFGADVSLAVPSPDLAAWVGIAAPLAIVDPADMAAPNDERPTLLLVPEHDQFRSPDSAADATSAWQATSLTTIAGGDHFLMGRSGVVADAIVEFVASL